VKLEIVRLSRLLCRAQLPELELFVLAWTAAQLRIIRDLKARSGLEAVDVTGEASHFRSQLRVRVLVSVLFLPLAGGLLVHEDARGQGLARIVIQIGEYIGASSAQHALVVVLPCACEVQEMLGAHQRECMLIMLVETLIGASLLGLTLDSIRIDLLSQHLRGTAACVLPISIGLELLVLAPLLASLQGPLHFLGTIFSISLSRRRNRIDVLAVDL